MADNVQGPPNRPSTQNLGPASILHPNSRSLGSFGFPILELGHEGQPISSTPLFDHSIYAAAFAILPDGGFAVLDNYSDSVYIVAPVGAPRARIPIPNPARGLLGCKTVDGLVAGNRLIASETGHGQVFEADLATKQASILFGFSEPDSWLGAITRDSDGTFQVYMSHSNGGRIYSFTERGAVRKLCTLPEKHVTGLASLGAFLFATVNHEGAVHRIHRFTGESESVLDGIDWPTDIEYLPVRLEGS